VRINSESLNYQRIKNKKRNDYSSKLVESLEHLFYNKINIQDNSFTSIEKIKYRSDITIFFKSLDQYFQYKTIKFFLKNKFALILPSIKSLIVFYDDLNINNDANNNLKNNMLSCLPYFLMDDDRLIESKIILIKDNFKLNQCWWSNCYHLYKVSALIKNNKKIDSNKQVKIITNFCRLFNRNIEQKFVKKYLFKKK
tara:strand:- start:1284 stop:1874 length:591 start_codon:yes stop_codon:yes gene_type:complete